MLRSRPVPGTGSRWWCRTNTRRSAGSENCSSIQPYRPRPIWPLSRSGSVESTATTVTPPTRSTELRGPNSSSKCTYPTFRESWLPGMTTRCLHSISSRYRRASAYSSLNPCDVRSPEQTTTSGFRSLTSVIARSRRSGRKNCCPQWRSLSWAIVNATGRTLEDPAHGVVEKRRDEGGGGQRQQPGDDDVAGDAPLDGVQPADRAGAHHRAGDDVRRRDREAEPRADVERGAGGELRCEAVLGLHLVDPLPE